MTLKSVHNTDSQPMRVSEGFQAQWHACSGIASGQGRALHSRTVSSRKRLYATNRNERTNFDK